MPFHFIFYSDTHLGFDFPVTQKSKYIRRGIDFFNNFHKIYDYALKNNIDTLVHGGDLFYRSKVPKKLVNHVYMILHEYAAKGLKTYIVPGNHERARLPGSLLIQDKNLFIFKHPESYIIDTSVGSVCLAGFPFERGDIRSNFKALVKSTQWQKHKADYNFLCLHQAIDGATVGPSNYMFRNRDDVVDINDIPAEFDLVLCGHIHRRQILLSEKGTPVIFAGSIERTSFAERGEPKGFYDITLHPEINRPKIKFIKLPARPMFILNQADKSDTSMLISQMKKIPANAIVRIKLEGNINLEKIRNSCPESMIISVRIPQNYKN